MNEGYLHSLIIRIIDVVNKLFIPNRFLVNMICAFQNKLSLYMVLDLMPGGDLRYYMAQKKSLTEDEASKFIE